MEEKVYYTLYLGLDNNQGGEIDFNTFEAAKKFGEKLKEIYNDVDYYIKENFYEVIYPEDP